MSTWETDETIEAHYHRVTGELMLSASDVLAWIRSTAEIQTHGCHRVAYTAMADRMAEFLIDETRHLVDGSGS